MRSLPFIALAAAAAGCTLFESGPRSGGGDDNGSNGSGSGSSIVGRTFEVDRIVQSRRGAGSYPEEMTAHAILVATTSAVDVDGTRVPATVGNFLAREQNGDPSNLDFQVAALWLAEIPVVIDYTIWLDTTLVTGHAASTFDDPIAGRCFYEWRLLKK
jgi:hypothetical protein